MSHSLLGRLPPLQAIGRSKCIDLDEPPVTLEDTAEDLVDSYLQSLEKDTASSPVYRFETEHARSASLSLLRGFRVLRPGSYYCKRVGSEVTGFTHCQKSVSFAVKHRELDRLLETRARLEFTRDLLSRMNAFGLFVGELQQLVKEESQTWHEICCNSLTNPPTTKLDQLCGICEDLRMQLSQWNSVKQAMHCDRHLRPLLSSLCSSLAIVRQRLRELSERAIFWVNQLILFGFKVLAHCDLERIGQETLWNIARGLEEYNLIVSTTRLNFLRQCPDDVPLSSFGAGSLLSRSDLLHGSLGRYDSTIPLMKVLKLLACERAKYAAVSAKVYFADSKEFLTLIKNPCLPLYLWSPRTSCSAEGGDGNEAKQSPNCGSRNSYSDSKSVEKVSSLDPLFVTGELLAPDLTSEISPLIDFARRESTFIGRFLQVFCHSTNLIKKQSNQLAADTNNASAVSRNRIPRLKNLRPKTIAFVAAPNANVNVGFNADLDTSDQDAGDRSTDNRNSNCEEVLKTEPSRKSVTWSDSLLALSIQQVTQEYMRILWVNFADHVYNYLVSVEWGSARDAKDHLGSIVLCPDILTMVIKCMVQHASVADTFPLGCRFALAGLAVRLQAAVACAAWDVALNSALSSAAADKCQGVQLTSEVYITITGKLLYETYQPLLSVLSVLTSDAGHMSGEGSGGVITWTDRVPASVLLSILKRLTVTTDVSFSWCSDKMLQLLASRAVASFLQVAFGDLQILADENDRAFRMSQHLCDQLMAASNNASDRGAIWEIKKSWKQANESHCHLQALVSSSQKQYRQLCLSSARDFFHNEMPAGKEWKRKGGEVMPIQHMDYIERAVDSLLEPVVAGVNRLRPAAQLDALTIAISDVCDAWTSNILSKKIRFSYYGACQLEMDILYLRTWLTSYISDTQLCRRLTSLVFLQYLDCVVLLLKQQPTGHQCRRSCSRVRQQPIRGSEKGFKDGCTDGTQSLSNTSTCTPSSDTNEDNKNGVLWDSKTTGVDRTSRGDAVTGASSSLEDGDLEGQVVPHKEQWLALRVHGGARNWPKLGSCFNNTNA